jgi:hypothetical protein
LLRYWVTPCLQRRCLAKLPRVVYCCVATSAVRSVRFGSARLSTARHGEALLSLLLLNLVPLLRNLATDRLSRVWLRGNSFHVTLPNNGFTYHTATSLLLFVPKSLTVHHRSFHSQAALATFPFSLALCCPPPPLFVLQPLHPLPP